MRSPQKGNYPFDKGAPRPQKRKYKSKVIKEKKSIETPLIEKFGVSLSENEIEATIDIKIISEGNCFEHWKKKHARHKGHDFKLRKELLEYIHLVKFPCVITFTRFAPKFLDIHDNLPYSFKWNSDSIANMLFPGQKAGRADNDTRISFRYDQVKSQRYYIKVRFTWSN